MSRPHLFGERSPDGSKVGCRRCGLVVFKKLDHTTGQVATFFRRAGKNMRREPACENPDMPEAALSLVTAEAAAA